MNQRGAFALISALFVIATATPCTAAEARLPIIDTHIHYSGDAWAHYSPETVMEKLDAAGVPWAVVSSSPDEGTLRLYRQDSERVVPSLRPYYGGRNPGNWFLDPQIIDYIEAPLARGIYRGVGEFHLFGERATWTPQIKRVVALAVVRDIPLHVHADAGPIRALFDIDPKVKILWAHAGMSTPPEIVGEHLDRYPRLWAELSFRAADIAPDGPLDPVWRDLFLAHADRFMIGTDTYVNARWDAYGELVDEHRRWLVQLPRAIAEAIAHANAERLFGAGRRPK